MLVSKYPISKDEALKYDAKDITITNNSTCDTAYYKLTIKDLNNSSINKDKINYQLIDKSDNSETVDKNPDNFLVEDSLTKGNSKSYSIRIWIDESATNTDLYVNGDTTKPIEYKYALNLESSDEEIKSKGMTASEFALANVGKNGLEEVKESDTVTSYRYRGKDVNNYVTFSNEIWRIIGMIPIKDANGATEIRYKLIKPESILNGTYDPDTVVNYYNKLDEVSKNMIINIYFTKDMGLWYENPKMHLMLVSDYNYAASTSCSKQCFSNGCNFDDDKENCIVNNWLYYDSREYTFDGLDADASGGAETVGVISDGHFSRELLGDAFDTEHRPTVALSSNVKISSGTGTKSDPYKLQLD